MLMSMQVLVLHVEGRVLTLDQLRAGDYVLPSELPLAQRLVEQGDWTAHSTSQQADALHLPGTFACPFPFAEQAEYRAV